MSSDLGAWIRDLRQARGWTQTQVGVMLGVSQARVSHWETGKESPGDDELRQLEIAFGEPARPGSGRPYGLAAGEFSVPDDFDDPLPEEVLRHFEGES